MENSAKFSFLPTYILLITCTFRCFPRSQLYNTVTLYNMYNNIISCVYKCSLEQLMIEKRVRRIKRSRMTLEVAW